jgi:uncharacterized repeat protein (TIGR01451 family)
MKLALPMLKAGLLVLAFTFVQPYTQLSAQVVRNYGSPVFSENVRGSHTMFGNTILGGSATVMNEWQAPTSLNGYRTSESGNDYTDMQNIDVDGTIAGTTFISYGANWKYSNGTAIPADNGGFNWTQSGYSDASWSGPAASPLRRGTGSGGTTLAADRNTNYFRTTVNITNPASFQNFVMTLQYDDGAVVYVNGTEVGRVSMPTGTVNFSTLASTCRNSTDGDGTITIPSSAFVNGTNVIAVEVHQGNGCNADVYFNLQLQGNAVNTFNSSSSDFVVPAGITNPTIKFARLYWGGRITTTDMGTNDVNVRTVKIRKGTSGGYQTVTAPISQVDKVGIPGTSSTAYQAYFDITAFVNTNKTGTYTVADIKLNTGSTGGNGGNYGGWTIMVVYEDPAATFSNIRIYDGFILVSNSAAPTSQTIQLSGLNPSSAFTGQADAHMSFFAWEGDANLGATITNPAGDYVKLNNVVVTNALNPAQNFWNGTITSNGQHVTTKNPNYINQMGIDIDDINIGSGYNITPGMTNMSIEFGTEADQYFPSVFGISMAANPPVVILDKTGTITGPGSSRGLLYPEETITYILSGKNNGLGNAINNIVVDTIPVGLNYVPNSMFVGTATGPQTPLTDLTGDDLGHFASTGGKSWVKFFVGTGATPTTGGTLTPDQSYSVGFKCKTPTYATPWVSVSNTGRIFGNNASDNQAYTDDGTYIFGPGNIMLPVTLTEFKAVKNGNAADLSWATAGELKNDRFEVERSTDGLTFTKVGALNGNGTTDVKKQYSFTDQLPANASIVYYRLRIVDFDGKSTFSKIVVVRISGNSTLNAISVFPNPFVSNVKLQLNSRTETAVTIRVINMLGQQEIVRKVGVQPGENIIVVQDLQSLKTGNYVLEVITEDGKTTHKITKK